MESSSSFRTPVEAAARVEAHCFGSVSSTSRLSSFGFSGTIAHGAFGALAEAAPARGDDRFRSLYRGSLSTGKPSRFHLRRDFRTASPAASTGTLLLPAMDVLFSEHVVGEGVLLPGVGYVEMAVAFSHDSQPALNALKFLRPCILPSL